MKLIDGKAIAEKIEEQIKKSGKTGGLGVILVGNDEPSRIYVKIKEKTAKRVGIKFEKIIYGETSDKGQETRIIDKIKELNSREDITGIIVQLPLPKHLDTNKIISAIDPQKDVDGYHPLNLKKFARGEFTFYPPVLGAVIEALKEAGVNIKEKTVALISKSEIFPIPYHGYFEKNAKNFIHCKPENLDDCLTADIVITAIGKKHYLKAKNVKEGAVVIDIGIVKEDKKIYGDADLDSLKDKCAAATPVPGGVGPITVARLLLNTIK